jgi:ubiquinone/menaquinone biosynthesis C-methylase UbiE
MPAASAARAEQIKDVNTRYHDAAASDYDSKWGINLGSVGQRQVRSKLAKALGGDVGTYDAGLEIGAGTGYFTLNLLQLGIVCEATATDISPGMLTVLEDSAERLGLDVVTVRCEAEELPFANESFDLVFGHAVLHHVPDLARAFAEFERVLRPGGTIVFCGEPSRYGHSIAALPKRAALAAAPLWRLAVGAHPRRANRADDGEGHEFEMDVDVHAFEPGSLRQTLRAAGFDAIRIRGEELVANLHGWVLRTLESTADPDRIPMRWRSFAFRSYLALQRIDSTVLEPRLPPALFYNLVLSARKPA